MLQEEQEMFSTEFVVGPGQEKFQVENTNGAMRCKIILLLLLLSFLLQSTYICQLYAATRQYEVTKSGLLLYVGLVISKIWFAMSE
jgi:hypothetical protein